MSTIKYYVQARKSVTSKRGLLAEGTEVFENDFGGGKKSIDGLLEKKIIGKEKPDSRTKAEIVKAREIEKKSKAAADTKASLDKKNAGDKKKEAAEKLESLKKEAAELKIDFPDKATAEEIEKLIIDKKNK
jgi:hypothetical protein